MPCFPAPAVLVGPAGTAVPAPVHSAVDLHLLGRRTLLPSWAHVQRPGVEGQVRAWLHEGDEVSGAHADERGRVGFSLGELEGERGRSSHAVGENDVAVDVDDGNRDGYVLLNHSASTRSAIFFAMVSKSMV